MGTESNPYAPEQLKPDEVELVEMAVVGKGEPTAIDIDAHQWHWLVPVVAD